MCCLFKTLLHNDFNEFQIVRYLFFSFLQKRYGGLSMGETYHSAVSADQLQTLFQLFEANSNFTLTNSANITSNAEAFTESLARTENAKVSVLLITLRCYV